MPGRPAWRGTVTYHEYCWAFERPPKRTPVCYQRNGFWGLLFISQGSYSTCQSRLQRVRPWIRHVRAPTLRWLRGHQHTWPRQSLYILGREDVYLPWSLSTWAHTRSSANLRRPSPSSWATKRRWSVSTASRPTQVQDLCNLPLHLCVAGLRHAHVSSLHPRSTKAGGGPCGGAAARSPNVVVYASIV